MPIDVEVRTHRGCPTLFVNGAPRTGLTFFFGRAADSGPFVRDFAAADIDLFSGVFGLKRDLHADGSLDFSGTDAAFRAVLDANPQALILPRVGLGQTNPPAAWLAEGADELQGDVPLGEGVPNHPRFSFASPVWRRHAAGTLEAFIRHCEAHYGEHVLGYHLAAGAFGEWSYGWWPVLSDYGPAQVAAFRTWLRAQYADVAALRAAWGREEVSFGTAAIPPPERRLRQPGDPCLFRPDADRDVLDYLTFHSEVLAEALVSLCGTAKATLRALGRRKLVGAFYGYQFKNLNLPANFHNSGHFAQQLVLESPDIDFIAAPYCYQAREHGFRYLAQPASGSIRLHGKLQWVEDDTFTCLSRPQADRARCPDRETTIGVLRRNLAGVLADGGALWWMDCGGNGPLRPGGQVDGWYRDAALMDNFAAMQRLAAARLQHGDYTPSAQVAVLVSDASVRFQRQDAALMDALVERQTFELAALGAPVDYYRTADLRRLFAQPWSRNYRLLVVLDALHLSADERDALRTLAQRDGRTLLWTYGAGIVDLDGFSPDAMAAVTGIRPALRWREEALMVNTFVTGTRLLYGTERPISPILYGDDPGADVKGWLLNSADPGLLVRQFADWRSIWSSAPAPPAALLRHYAREAGVHLYVETGEQVIVDGDLLTLHAGFAGERTVHLPRAATVTDAYTGATVATAADAFVATLARGETGTWWVK